MRPKWVLQELCFQLDLPSSCCVHSPVPWRGGGMDGGDTAGHSFSLPAPAWPWKRRCEANTASRSEGGKGCLHLFARKQAGWPDIAPQLPRCFLRKAKTECGQQHKVQLPALKQCWLLLTLSTSSFSAADEPAHLFCLVLRPPLLTKCGAWWLSGKGPKAGQALWDLRILGHCMTPDDIFASGRWAKFAAFTTDSGFSPVPLYQVGRGLCFIKFFLDPSCSREANTGWWTTACLTNGPKTCWGADRLPPWRITIII